MGKLVQFGPHAVLAVWGVAVPTEHVSPHCMLRNRPVPAPAFSRWQ